MGSGIRVRHDERFRNLRQPLAGERSNPRISVRNDDVVAARAEIHAYRLHGLSFVSDRASGDGERRDPMYYQWKKLVGSKENQSKLGRAEE